MDFESRRKDWKQMLAEKQALNSLLESPTTCKTCICMDLLKSSLCGEIDSQKVINEILDRVGQASPHLGTEFSNNLATLTKRHEAQPLQEKIDYLVLKLSNYDESLTDLLKSNSVMRESIAKITFLQLKLTA